MKVLITGGPGFIGSHLKQGLLGNGDLVMVIDDLSAGQRANIASLEADSHFRFVHGSVRHVEIMP